MILIIFDVARSLITHYNHLSDYILAPAAVGSVILYHIWYLHETHLAPSKSVHFLNNISHIISRHQPTTRYPVNKLKKQKINSNSVTQ